MAANTPPAGTVLKDTVYGYRVAIYSHGIFGTQRGLRAVYENEGSWHYLAEQSHFLAGLSTKEKVDAVFTKALVTINAAVENTLKPKDDGDAPESGVARIEWLLNNLVVTNNIITKGTG